MIAEETRPTVRYGSEAEAERPLGRSIMRGLSCRCPRCGEGRLFRAYLKPVETCAVCGEEIFHQRADDLPPYIVIFLLGHIVVGGYMTIDSLFVAPSWVHLAIWCPITVIAALLLIQPVKGAVIGLQWALKMHGFGGGTDEDQGRGGPREPS